MTMNMSKWRLELPWLPIGRRSFVDGETSLAELCALAREGAQKAYERRCVEPARSRPHPEYPQLTAALAAAEAGDSVPIRLTLWLHAGATIGYASMWWGVAESYWERGIEAFERHAAVAMQHAREAKYLRMVQGGDVGFYPSAL